MNSQGISIRGLSKRFDDRVLFDGLSFEAQVGCIALEDEHGSGKSTLLRILVGEAAADAGEVWVDGVSMTLAPDEARHGLVYVPEDYATYPVETGRAFLDGVAVGKPVARHGDTLSLADAFGLTPHLDKRFEQMSFGTRKKFFLTAAAAGDFRVVIADEPTSGLDASSRAVLAELFDALGRDRLVFFTSYDEKLVRDSGATVVRFADMRPVA